MLLLYMLIPMLDLGVQAAQLIVGSPNPIETLMQLSEDFPRYATELARKLDVSRDIQLEMTKMSRAIPKGMSMAWLNGKVLDNPDEFNPFKCVILRFFSTSHTLNALFWIVFLISFAPNAPMSKHSRILG